MQMSGMARLFVGVRALVRDAHDDSLDVVGFDCVLADEIEQRIERRLDRRADRPALDVGVHDFVTSSPSSRDRATAGSGLRP